MFCYINFCQTVLRNLVLSIGLRFCVLKKDVSEEKKRPEQGSTFVPTVRTPQEPLSFQEDLSDTKTFPSLLPLIRDGQLEEAKQYIEEGADVNEEDQHGVYYLENLEAKNF